MKKYFLKNKDTTLLEFEFGQEKFQKINIDIFKITYINNEKKHLLPKNYDFTNNRELESWIKRRKLPKNREFFDEIISVFPNKNLMTYIDYSFALSLNDSFWVLPEDKFDYKWEEYNLYKNKFSSIISNLAFTGDFSISSKLKDITTSPEFTTNGMLKKCWYREDDKIFLLKGSTPEYANKGKEAYSEYYMQQVAKAFGINFVFYDLMEFHKQLVSKCEIFTNENIGYVPMYNLINKNENREKEIYRVYGERYFEDLMLFDAIIGNTDRHLGNFGMLIDNNTGELISPAPIFDNGLSFLNHLTKEEIKNKIFIINEYNKNKTNAFEQSFEECLKIYVDNRHREILEKLTNFKLEKHKKFNLEKVWLDGIENNIRRNAEFALNILKNKKNKF